MNAPSPSSRPRRLDAAAAWWQQRAGRERILLALMLLGITLFVAWYGVAAPLLRWQDNGVQQRQLATARQQQLQLDLALLQDVAADLAAVQAQWQASLHSAGLTIAQQQLQPGQPLVVELAAQPESAVMAWLAGLPADLQPDRLQLWRSNGAVHARLQRLPPGPAASPD